MKRHVKVALGTTAEEGNVRAKIPGRHLRNVTHIDDASDEPNVAARISINGRFNHLLTNSDRPKVHQHLKCSNDGGSLAVQFLTMALDSYSPVSVVALQCLPERLPFSSFYFSQDAVLGFQGLVMHWPAHLLRFYLFFFSFLLTYRN